MNTDQEVSTGTVLWLQHAFLCWSARAKAALKTKVFSSCYESWIRRASRHRPRRCLQRKGCGILDHLAGFCVWFRHVQFAVRRETTASLQLFPWMIKCNDHLRISRNLLFGAAVEVLRLAGATSEGQSGVKNCTGFIDVFQSTWKITRHKDNRVFRRRLELSVFRSLVAVAHRRKRHLAEGHI